MAANEDALGDLHTKVATVLSKALDGQELPAYTDEDGVEQPGGYIPPSAALVTATIQFLKNNNITCAPAEDNAIGELAAKVRAKREARASRADMRAASQDMDFLAGLPTEGRA